MGNELQLANQGLWGHIKKIWTTDASQRSIAQYLPCSVEAFFSPDNGLYNTIISGGNADIRNKAIVSQAICAEQNNFPVVILHEGNSRLTSLLRRTYNNSSKYCEISPSKPCFEPFQELNISEIASQILNTVPDRYNLNSNVRYYIEGVFDYLQKRGKRLSFHMLSTCPHALMFQKVNNLEKQRIISTVDAQNIKSKLTIGQKESSKLDTFLTSFKMEASAILYKPKSRYSPVNIVSELKRQRTITIDISSVTNEILLNTIVFQLKLAASKGIQYALIVDSIPLHASKMFSEYIKAPSNKISRFFATDDLFTMVGGDEKVFTSLIGDSANIIVMAHPVGQSAIKWAEMFGQYDKYEQTISKGKSKTKKHFYSILSSPTTSTYVNTQIKREYLVKPEIIAHLGDGEAYILSIARGELAHLVLTT